MTNETPTEAAGQQNATAATFTVNAQYVKDLSFENPNIPGLLTLEAEPSVEMNIDVKGSNLDNDFYEVVLTLSCKGSSGETTLFVAELSYASLISLNDVPEEQIQRILFVECPILMFPFARNIIADATRDGGYPPILMQPVDFQAIFDKGTRDPS
ncbi:MAG: protein-export chaperone SecB [Pseudomonadota bacterium]|nr:protein-export chaperone SecB [Pseudomonadota bacterium]